MTNLQYLQLLWEIDFRTNDGQLDLNEFVDRMQQVRRSIASTGSIQ